MKFKVRTLSVALAGSALGSLSTAQFTNDATAPNEGSRTENIDFGDVDLDGDWDAAFADGGDFGQDQNRIWINQGGLQGGTEGQFIDDTAARLPVWNDQSRDIEFVDIEADGDIDLYISNTAQVVNQGNRWWVNQGGLQVGSLGTYMDDTANRWVGLNSANSSLPSSLLIPNAANPETFIDWSCDCDFADLDNDGDLDLFHSSYGGAFGGQVPSRIFLNDGDGFFQEHNPSGFKLTGTNISAGQPGLWAEGTQETNTNSVDGTHCDIASSALDIDLMDIDNDFDIDLLHGSRQTETRLFKNRLEETGSLIFRDMSEELFPGSAWSTGGGHYEQEMGDLDRDGDIDIYGLNWSSFSDSLIYNDGTGHYSGTQILPGSGADDNEGDFLDWDNDGDMDLYVANFSGSNKLYRNQFAQTGTALLVVQQTGLENGTTLDADCADVDGDGDTDIINAQDGNNDNDLLINTTDVPDTHGPYFVGPEAAGDGTGAGADEVVRIGVHDNAPYYITWYNTTQLNLSIDGFDVPALPMASSGGQIFRGVIPGNLVGDVEYSVTSADEYGNASTSGTESYTNLGNTGIEAGTTSPSSVGTPRLRSLSQAVAGKPVYLAVSDVAAGTLGVVLMSASNIGPLDLGDGIVLNIGAPFLGSPIGTTADSNGHAVLVGATQPALAGNSLLFQYFGMDGTGGDAWASSNRLRLSF